jgi:hypothetical protein
MRTEQEYDAQADMVEDQEPAESGPGPYPEPFANTPQQTNTQHQLGPQTPGLHLGGATQAYNSLPQLLDAYDPMLDMDPFGLSASMQFPTQFSFDTSSMR